MPDLSNNNITKDSVYRTDVDVYGKEIKSVPAESKKIGIDTDNTLFHNITSDTITSSHIDLNSINSFSNISQSRDTVFNLIDSMYDEEEK